MDIEEVRAGLHHFIPEVIGGRAKLTSLEESDGHAGLTFLFAVDEGTDITRDYVIKLPPKGVKRRGNTDVYRQAPLLRTLNSLGLPVPQVPWAYEDNPWFEVPFIIMERMPGRTFFVWDPHPDSPTDRDTCERIWEQAASWLARVHSVDWRAHLPDWEQPADLRKEITRWERIYAKAPEPAWIKAVERVEKSLLNNLPDGTPVGLFHGDYQPGNCLYEGSELIGIIDWELSGIGAQLLDVGWLMMVADQSVWTPQWMPVHPPAPQRLRDIYSAERGCDFDQIPWYTALACYRLASITCLNVKLHRSGQRHDPIWEHNGRSVMPMLNLAERMLAGGTA